MSEPVKIVKPASVGEAMDASVVAALDQIDDLHSALVRDEAIASWGAMNRIREIITAQIATEIQRGKDPTRLIKVLQDLSATMSADMVGKIVTKVS